MMRIPTLANLRARCRMRASLCPSSLQMPITTWHWKVQTNTMKAYRRQQQYIYNICQVGHVTPGHAFLISVCILMLPMLQLLAEHAQRETKCHVNLINQWHVDLHRMNISHTPLVLPSLSNLRPAMVLQNSVVRLNISCPSYTSSQFGICCTSASLHQNIRLGLGRRVVAVVLVLLLLLSGDIETNPGPVGELFVSA